MHIKIFTLLFTGKPAVITDFSNVDWAPSVELGKEDMAVKADDRYNRRKNRQEKKKEKHIVTSLCSRSECSNACHTVETLDDHDNGMHTEVHVYNLFLR